MNHHRVLLGSLLVVLVSVLLLATGCSSDRTSSAQTLGPATTTSVGFGTPPDAPTGLQTLKVDVHGFLLTWGAPEGPVDGYRIYVYDPTPSRVSAYRQVNTDLEPTSSYDVYAGDPGDHVFVRVSAVRAIGGEGPLSEPLEVLLGGETLTSPDPVGEEPGGVGSPSPTTDPPKGPLPSRGGAAGPM